MRRIVDLLILLMVTAVLAGVAYPRVRHLVPAPEDPARAAAEEHTRRALAAIQEQVVLRAAVGEAEAGAAGVATEVSPGWFRGEGAGGGGLPINELVSHEHPWVDLAPPGDSGTHPPDPVARRRDQAGFWYNPARGVVRARVAPAGSPEATLDLYNRINRTALPALPAGAEARRPVSNPAGVGLAAAEAEAEGAPAEAIAPAPTPRTLLDAGR